VKYDGFRLLVHRDGDRVRLLTRNGDAWSNRSPWIVESALNNRQKRFVIDGEAVVLGVDGVADFNALYFRKHDDELDPISDFVTVVPWLDQIARSSSSTPHHFLFR
jgi:bifunctional non-homologous end joining protein LigD